LLKSLLISVCVISAAQHRFVSQLNSLSHSMHIYEKVFIFFLVFQLEQTTSAKEHVTQQINCK